MKCFIHLMSCDAMINYFKLCTLSILIAYRSLKYYNLYQLVSKYILDFRVKCVHIVEIITIDNLKKALA